MHKKGQVTAFIILGILVVAGIIGVYFAKDYVLKSSWQRAYEKSLTVPKQAESVKNYIDSCIGDLAGTGVDLLGQQGGYIVIPHDPIRDPLDKFTNSLEIFPGFRTPFWYYRANNNIEVFQKPTLADMEDELEAYVDLSLKECLGGFSGFEGYDIDAGSVRSKVEIKNDEVLVTTGFPVHIKLKGFSFIIKEFYTKVDVPLGKLYDDAVQIYNRENLGHFLEERTVNVLVLNDEIPVTGVTRDCGTKVWARANVIDAIKNYVPLNIQMLRARGTNYESFREGDYYELDLGVMGDMTVNFYTSKDWPYEIEIIPEGELLKAESVTKSAGALEGLAQSFFCMNYYQFLYNMKYPVLVILSEDGYTFKFATQVVIERNEPRESSFEPVTFSEADRTFCENKQNKLDVYVYDAGTDVNNADIKFKCINNVCDIGQTEGNHLEALFPPCVNGIIIASKEGYNKGKTVVSTNEPSVISVNVDKVEEVDVNVRVTGRGNIELEDDEKVFISMTDNEKEFSASLVFPDQDSINLIPGNYEVYAYIMKEYRGISVAGERKRVCSDVPQAGVAGWFGGTEERCITVNIPSIKLDNVMVGGARFSMYVNKGDLMNDLEFYIPFKGVPRDYEDLSEINLEVDNNFVYPKFQ